jgi:hypothetical protein
VKEYKKSCVDHEKQQDKKGKETKIILAEIIFECKHAGTKE